MCENIQTGIKGRIKAKERGQSPRSDLDSHSFFIALFLQMFCFCSVYIGGEKTGKDKSGFLSLDNNLAEKFIWRADFNLDSSFIGRNRHIT